MAQQVAASFTISQSSYNLLAGNGSGNVTVQILYDDANDEYSVSGSSDIKALTTLHAPCPRPCPTIEVNAVS